MTITVRNKNIQINDALAQEYMSLFGSFTGQNILSYASIWFKDPNIDRTFEQYSEKALSEAVNQLVSADMKLYQVDSI